MTDFQNRIDAEVKELIAKYENDEIKLIDFAIEVLNYAALESPDIATRVNQILNSHKKAVGKPKQITAQQIDKIHALKKNGVSQEKIAFETGLSLSSVRRELKRSCIENG